MTLASASRWARRACWRISSSCCAWTRYTALSFTGRARNSASVRYRNGFFSPFSSPMAAQCTEAWKGRVSRRTLQIGQSVLIDELVLERVAHELRGAADAELLEDAG